MRMCQSHWDELRQAIDARGLSPLVAKSGEAALESLTRTIEGTAGTAEFDPLMSANFAIFAAFLEDAGLAGMGDHCPLCEVEKQQVGLARNWIDGCCDDQLDQARQLGRVPQLS